MKALIVVGDATDMESEGFKAGIAALIENYEKNSGQKVDSIEIKRSGEYYGSQTHGLTLTELASDECGKIYRSPGRAFSSKGERKRNKKDSWR